jgi:indole-3-glycerol phosphate synthase/phosphoribosylanthranilate isomerase
VSVLDDIVAVRKGRVARQGHALGTDIPATRGVPLVPFGADPFFVCEVKRRSPSRGDIAPGLDAVGQARAYAARGVRSISVLTEQDHFNGSLEDLIRVKRTLPGVSVLRKDFLLDEEDIEVSWRAGADAVLLIAAILDEATLGSLHRKCRSLGLQALVEVHGDEDARKCRALAPQLTGINSRDLATFSVDLAHPLVVRRFINWKTRLVFESGIRSSEDVLFALSGGFSGVLVGEAATRSLELVSDLLSAFGRLRGDFWARLYARREPGRPLVKVCGITRREDAEAAASLGADALGFVFAPSKRRVDPALLRDLRHIAIPKIAVVVTENESGGRRLDPAVTALLAEGLLDAVQFHGDERPDECAAMAFPYYKALRIRGLEEVEAIARYHCPRVLIDAFSADAAGGTGKCIPPELAREAKRRLPLWLAGGIGPDNVGEILRELEPELIDASSRLEESPGAKDRVRLSSFFREIERNAHV